jgi:hypothetical protein
MNKHRGRAQRGIMKYMLGGGLTEPKRAGKLGILSVDGGFGRSSQPRPPCAADVPASVGLPLRIHSKPTAIAAPIIGPAM